MTKVRFISETMPQSGNDLQQALREALERTAPLEDFVQVVRDLTQHEMRHGMNSRSFYAQFLAGEMGDEIDLIRWANMYEVYQETKAELEQMGDTVIASVPPDLSEVLREIDGILYP